MLVYGASFVLALLCAYGTTLYPRDAKSRKVLWVLCWVALALPAMLRYNVGVDYSRYQGYEQLYQIYGEGQSIPQGMELGFVYLIRVLWTFSHNAQLMFALTSGVTLWLVLRAAARYAELSHASQVRWAGPVIVALFVSSGFYFESLNIIRQWIAVACALNGALEFLPASDDMAPSTAKKFLPTLKFLGWVAVGTLFHTSALTYLILIPLSFIHLKPRTFVLVLIGSVGLLFVGRPLMGVVLAGTRFARYLGSAGGAYAKADPHVDSMLTTTVTLISVLVLYGYAQRKQRGIVSDQAGLCLQDFHNFQTLLCWSQLICCALAISGFFLPAIVDRVMRLFMPFMLLALPDALVGISNRRVRVGLVLIICALWLGMSGLRVLYGGQYGVLPYYSILW